jgi:hypothetical protein
VDDILSLLFLLQGYFAFLSQVCCFQKTFDLDNMLYSSSCAALASHFNPISSIGYSSSCSSCNHSALGLSSRRRIVLLAAAVQLRASDEKDNRIRGGSGVGGELVRCGRRAMVERAVLPGAALLISMTVAGSVNAAAGEVEGPAAAAKNELIQSKSCFPKHDDGSLMVVVLAQKIAVPLQVLGCGFSILPEYLSLRMVKNQATQLIPCFGSVRRGYVPHVKCGPGASKGW